MTRRADLDQYCLNRFRSAGGQFRNVDRIRSMVQHDDSVTIHTSRGAFSARYLMGADGANSRIRALLNHKTLQTRPYCIHKIFGLEADVRVSRPEQVSMTLAFFQNQPGYYWIFPKKTHVNVGIFSRARTPMVSEKIWPLLPGGIWERNTCHMSPDIPSEPEEDGCAVRQGGSGSSGRRRGRVC